MQLHWLLYLLLTSLFAFKQSSTQSETSEDETLHRIGLKVGLRSVTVSHNLIETEVGVLFKQPSSDVEYKQATDVLDTFVDKIKNTAAYKEDGPKHESISKILENFDQEAIAITETSKAIAKFRDQSITHKNRVKCSLEYEPILTQEIRDVISTVKTMLANIPFDQPKNFYDSKDAAFNDHKFLIQNATKVLGNFKTILLERFTLLDQLSDYQVHNELLMGLQSSECIPFGTNEKSEVLFCEKRNVGFYCQLRIKSMSKPQTYRLYGTINYKGIELDTGSEKSHFVRKDDSWKILTCENDENGILNEMDVCTIANYDNDCSNSFRERKIKNYIKYCNFTRKKPKPYLLTGLGAVIQHENAFITLVTPKQTTEDGTIIEEVRKNLNTPVPVGISTNKVIEIKIGDNIITLPPISTAESEQVVASWLTDADIMWLDSSLHTEEVIDNLDSGDLIDVIMFAIFGIIIPVILLVLKRLHSQQQNQEDFKNLKTRLKQQKANLKENKALIKMVDF